MPHYPYQGGHLNGLKIIIKKKDLLTQGFIFAAFSFLRKIDRIGILLRQLEDMGLKKIPIIIFQIGTMAIPPKTVLILEVVAQAPIEERSNACSKGGMRVAAA